MRAFHLILAGAALFTLTGCSSNPRDMRIVGRWQGVRHEAFNVEIIIEYDEDGTVKATTRTLGITVAGRGKYRLLDDHTITQEITFKGDTERTVKEKQKISFDDTGMTQTDENGNTVKYRKISNGGKNRSPAFWADVERGYREGAEWDPGRLLDWLNGYAVRWLGLLVAVLGLLIVVDLGRIQRQIRALSDQLARWEKGQAQATNREELSKQEKKV